MVKLLENGVKITVISDTNTAGRNLPLLPRAASQKIFRCGVILSSSNTSGKHLTEHCGSTKTALFVGDLRCGGSQQLGWEATGQHAEISW